MKLVIDLDEHEAIQDFGVRSAAPTFEFKSQDTIDWDIYFVQGGIVQDLGSSLALKYGMIQTGDTTDTMLAYQTTSTYSTDSEGNVFYLVQVNYNTSQMASAISGKTSLPCTSEIRYQTSGAEIIHSLDVGCLVFETILVETGVTPPDVGTGYPDASAIELLVHKDVASGYAGLNGSAQLFGAQIPVDGQTVVINGSSQIASASILALTSANWTTPASGVNVTVTVNSTTNLKAGSYIRVPIAGYYIVESITDSTHVVLQNNGDPFNAISGTTITVGAPLLPAQAAAGGGGSPGQAAYTQTTASFVVPTVGATVSVSVGSTAWMGGNGYWVFITGAGYYAVQSIIDTTHVVLTNTGSASNAIPGSTINSGATVSAAGPTGAAGATGTPLSAYDTLAASFTMPNAAASTTITIGSTAWLATNQVIYIASAGYFQVATISSATQVSITNLNYPGNAAAASTIASGSRVSPGGLQGAQGAGGPGLNAFTTLSANYIQPAVNSNVTITVGTTAWMAIGQTVFVVGGGYYTVATVPDLTHVNLTNLGGPSNAGAGSTVTGSGTQAVSPAGANGTSGVNAYTITTLSFVTPAAGASVTVNVGITSWASIGQILFVAGAGYYQVAAILNPTQFSLTNLAGYGNVAGGTNVGSGATVSPSGSAGPAGAPGPQGAAGRDGAYSTVYTGSSVQGNGGVASPVSLVGDIAVGTGAYDIYQRDVGGNPLWAAIPTDGTTITVSAGKLKAIFPPDSIGAHIETPTVKSYTLDLSTPVAYTITGLVMITSAGSCTVSLLRNGSAISGASGLSATTTISTTSLSQATVAGDKIQLQVTATSSGADLQISMHIQK